MVWKFYKFKESDFCKASSKYHENFSNFISNLFAPSQKPTETARLGGRWDRFSLKMDKGNNLRSRLAMVVCDLNRNLDFIES